MRKLLWVAFLISLACVDASANSQNTSDDQCGRSLNVLRTIVQKEKGFAKVHAAESLVELGYDANTIERDFLKELDDCDPNSLYWVGVCRVLVKVADNDTLRQSRVNHIYKRYVDKNYKWREASIETLAKVGYVPDDREKVKFDADARSGDPVLAPLAQWVLANSLNSEDLLKLSEMLLDKNETTALLAAYALSFIDSLPPGALSNLVQVYEKEPGLSKAKGYILSALYIHSDEQQRAELRPQLLNLISNGEQDSRADVCLSLVRKGTSTEVDYLVSLLEDENPDVRGQAAHAILRIQRREMPNLVWLDWAVVTLYVVGLLVVGWVYSLTNKSSEDYLLGGRKMKSWAVGISLFATLLSTLSYLMLPGEMIKHGPMFLTCYAAYPFIYLVVGWFIIPAFMKIKVTSAYELLERRFGLSVRMFGIFYFLAIRLLWMATIIYTTTSLVLIPVAGIDPKHTILLSVALGAITIVYTSLGGLKAVVLTSVIQTFILILGALISLALIVHHFGSLGVCIPGHWLPNWDRPALGFDPSARISMLSIIIMMFLWYVCTAGSDQMTIQRYFATRNVREARKMFAINLSSGLIVNPILAMLGFALIAFFKANPQYLPDGESISSAADQLFPRFIVLALPAGISGLVVAGILSAGMSSLSSGINAVSSVITIDIIKKFKKTGDEFILAKFSSWLIGFVVVLLSILVAKIEGNLLEVVQKTVNLFASPLFILFFMALFVPFATILGTLIGSLVSLLIGFLIVFDVIDLSFTWIMPSALGTGLPVGVVLSYICCRLKR